VESWGHHLSRHPLTSHSSYCFAPLVANLSDSHRAYIQAFGHRSRGHQRIGRIFKTCKHTRVWVLADLKRQSCTAYPDIPDRHPARCAGNESSESATISGASVNASLTLTILTRSLVRKRRKGVFNVTISVRAVRNVRIYRRPARLMWPIDRATASLVGAVSLRERFFCASGSDVVHAGRELLMQRRLCPRREQPCFFAVSAADR
jgi:hypothetical protein